VNNFKINLYKRLPNFEKYDTIVENKKLKLFSNLYLPVELIKKDFIEVKEKEIQYTQEEAKQLGINKCKEKLDKDLIIKKT